MIPFASQKKDANEVLTSIRRMVSEEARNKAAETSEPLELGIADLAHDAPLMLTPEQAVVAGEDEATATHAAPKKSAQASEPTQPEGHNMTDAAPTSDPVNVTDISEATPREKHENLLLDDIAEDTGAMFDEARLRSMIRDVIREEFEGELGERVSRNIRRLVRREISQAFNLGKSQD